MIKSIPNGVYPTMITPFKEDKTIDYDAVLKLIEWYSDKVDGLFAVCQSSEMFFLSFEERLELMRFVKDNAPAGMTVIASGHVADTLDEQAAQALEFIKTGIDAYVFISNRFAEKDDKDDVFLENVGYVISKLPDIAFGIYECPYPYKRLISPKTLGALAKTGRFAFIKDTCCDADVMSAKIKACEGTPLKLFNANSASLLLSLRHGAAGFSGVMGNFHPELYKWLCENFDKEPEKAEIMQSFLGLASLTERQIYPVNAKYYLSLEGVPMTTVTRSRTYDMTISEQLEMRQLKTFTGEFKKNFKL